MVRVYKGIHGRAGFTDVSRMITAYLSRLFLRNHR